MRNHNVVNVSAVLPTRNRAAILKRTLESLIAQNVLPRELIVIDASDDNEDTKNVVQAITLKIQDRSRVIWNRASVSGAAVQRNQGVALASQPFVLFFDDDIVFEAQCVERLMAALESDRAIGGASAMITNQKYHPPGAASRFVFRLMGGCHDSYAGKVIGPAVNLLPEDREDLPDIVAVDWLNLGCTLYRRETLPSPPFPSNFTGYSMMEDMTLSLTVGKQWKLVNARTARIFHDSQPGSHKSNPVEMEEMAIVNRHYVMTKVLGRTSVIDYAKFLVWVLFCHAAAFRTAESRRQMISRLRGQWRGIKAILASR